MDTEKLIKRAKTIMKIVPFVTAGVGVLSLALSKYEEKQENYSREFPEIENELKTVIDQVRYENGN